MIDKNRVTLEYFDPRITDFKNIEDCGSACASCGACRDCGTCVEICPESAISKVSKENDEFEYVVDETRCIGCGFCAGACPCGVWDLIENTPMD
jgi:Fe-S-cluster-containing hydrogenase component 2